MKLKCVACSHSTTWDESFGHRHHLTVPLVLRKKLKMSAAGTSGRLYRKLGRRVKGRRKAFLLF